MEPESGMVDSQFLGWRERGWALAASMGRRHQVLLLGFLVGIVLLGILLIRAKPSLSGTTSTTESTTALEADKLEADKQPQRQPHASKDNNRWNSARSVLEKADLGCVSGSFKDAGMGAMMGSGKDSGSRRRSKGREKGDDGGLDVEDTCILQ
ncbi:hypothetical protein K458DRAFT_384861 [Lentithecium fluviatile CBS 122367]|uniref:Uncharacterized protein n=1 Tax=Lentithecium fluviatile CBS 122367 TaxID=1168545 RepID=A0A6G1JDP5_9PLEO|nr:hypothetical protein K458DRAFT_384861 [Lentithecium fluviatile CBS 122367]